MISHDTMQALLAFRRERDWEQFHTPKNLAIAIAVEASELLEAFQWTVDNEMPTTIEAKLSVQHELADVAILVSYLAHDLGIDVESAVLSKLERNRVNYPVGVSRGSNLRKPGGSGV